MPAKRRLPPLDFDAVLAAGDLDAAMAVLRLGEMAVAWVLANPDPVLVPPHLTYRR